MKEKIKNFGKGIWKKTKQFWLDHTFDIAIYVTRIASAILSVAMLVDFWLSIKNRKLEYKLKIAQLNK